MKVKDKKTVIITGGSKGIGAAIAKAFYQAGMNVFIGARNNTGLAKQLGPRAHFIRMDVRKENDHLCIVKKALELTKRIDVFINCAGVSQWKKINKVSESFWNTMIDTNLKGTMWGCKIAAKYFKNGGCIINMSSLAGKRGSANNSVYCASKFGVTGLTQALAKELGPKGIRVNAICPVYVETQGVFKALKEKQSPAQGKSVKRYLSNFKKQESALGTLPTAGEVAQTCLFLSSDKASAITGQSINVDCGVLPQ